MYIKIIYATVYFVAIISLLLIIKILDRDRTQYAGSLKRAMFMACTAILANIMVAFSQGELSAGLAYCLYFASIDWIIMYLFGFCLSYTDHSTAKERLKIPAYFLATLDSVSIFLNIFLGHSFYIYTSNHHGTVFYQTGFRNAYYAHLAFDYVMLLGCLTVIVYRIIHTYSFYRIKYLIILSVLLLVIILNLIYMALGLVLDASVIFYAVAGALICFSIRTFVPGNLLISSIKAAVDSMNEGLIIFDINNEFIFANSFSIRNFNIDPAKYDHNCEPVATVMQTINENTFKTVTSEYIQADPDDPNVKTRHFRIKYNQLTDHKDRPLGTFFLIEDTTEEVYYMKELNEAKNAADNANQAKSTFLANMSHEIRTPLNSIMGMNELIMRNAASPQLKEYSANINEAGETLITIISDVLDFSRIEAGKTEVVIKEYEPYMLLRDCYYFFEQEAIKKDLYIHIICDEDLPRLLYGDPKLIGQVISNIVSNAIKYTQEGGVTLDMTFDMTDKDTIDLIIDISDTGMGISEEDLPFLFDSFHRVNEIQNATVQGTGLGLSITKELCLLMKGDVNVRSTPGEGTRFTVIIPQEVSDHTPIGPLANPQTLNLPEYKESFKAPDAGILVVDDVHVNIMVVEGLLKPTELYIDTATSGDEAIKKCSRRKYDLILLDHRMPDKDGLETFEEISRKGLNTDTPVIMLTAHAISGMAEQYRQAGFCDYITKPIRPEELEAALIRHLPKDKVIL